MPRLSPRSLLRGDIARLELAPRDALVLLALIDRADRDRIAWPSQVRLARELNLSRQGVQRSVARLIAAGAITEVEQGRSGRSTRYRVADNLPA